MKERPHMLIVVDNERKAEDLADYFAEQGMPSHYLHGEIDPEEQQIIINDFRQKALEILVAVSSNNLYGLIYPTGNVAS